MPINKAIVGGNAFAHESGIHQHGVMAERTTYEIMTPESIGLSTNKMVLGKHSGRHAFVQRVSELGYTLTDEQTDKFFSEFKALCDRKKTVTDRDIEAIITSKMTTNGGTYKLLTFSVQCGNKTKSTCSVQLEKDGAVLEDVALGDGPIDAAYNAVDKLVEGPEHTLDDYAIHSISEGEDALGEVIVKIKSDGGIITGRGLSMDIIEASILAYINGVNKLLEMGVRHEPLGDS